MDNSTLVPIKAEISAAFVAVSPSTPADLALLSEPSEGEERHLELELKGLVWTELDRDFWLQWWPSFGTLLPASYRYYVPSLLGRTVCRVETD